jgi:hypothetical protein
MRVRMRRDGASARGVVLLLTRLAITDRREPTPKEIVARILRLPGFGVYAVEVDEAANTLTLTRR